MNNTDISAHMALVDDYASERAEAHCEKLYGGSKSYAKQCLKDADAARAAVEASARKLAAPERTERTEQAAPQRDLGVEEWAELFRLREAVKGPPGFETWQDAAVHERLLRVKAERIQAVPQQAAPGFVMVPVKFMRGFHTLAHNWSLEAIPPDYYYGVEKDAFKSAYARCGADLAKLKELLDAARPLTASPTAPTEASEPVGDKLADRALAKSFRETPREASLADQAGMRRAISDPLTNRAFNMDGCTTPPPAPVLLSDAERDVLAERERQKSVEGWTPEHDDAHDCAEMAAAASGYALAAADALHPYSQGDGQFTRGTPPPEWPEEWVFKPAEPRRMLVKAGALILAEIERLDRAIGRASREAK